MKFESVRKVFITMPGTQYVLSKYTSLHVKDHCNQSQNT